MEKYVASPQLGFSEAVRLAMSRLFDFNGRSRRSEFWWFMLAFYIVCYVVGFIISLFLPALPAAIINSSFWIVAMGVTVRRLQDNGHSKWWVFLSFIICLSSFVTRQAARDTPNSTFVILQSNFVQSSAQYLRSRAYGSTGSLSMSNVAGSTL